MPTSIENSNTAEDMSMPDIFSCVRVSRSPQFWRRLSGFVGPGFLISVGDMDPGNWATDLAGGSRYGYTLLFVIMASNLMAILLQSLSLKLGIASKRDLAQACRETYSRPTSVALWLFDYKGFRYLEALVIVFTSDRRSMGPFVNRAG